MPCTVILAWVAADTTLPKPENCTGHKVGGFPPSIFVWNSSRPRPALPDVMLHASACCFPSLVYTLCPDEFGLLVACVIMAHTRDCLVSINVVCMHSDVDIYSRCML